MSPSSRLQPNCKASVDIRTFRWDNGCRAFEFQSGIEVEYLLTTHNLEPRHREPIGKTDMYTESESVESEHELGDHVHLGLSTTSFPTQGPYSLYEC